MKKNTIHLPMQYFAEDADQSELSGSEPEGQEIASDNYEELVKTDKSLQSFLDSRVQNAVTSAVQRALDKERILSDEKVSEAEKLARMTKEEKQAYELKKAQDEIAHYREAENIRSLKDEALKLADKKGLPASLVDMIPFNNMKADDVTKQIDNVKAVFDKAVSNGIACALNGAGTPASAGMSARAFTKEEIKKMSPDQINANWTSIQAQMADGGI